MWCFKCHACIKQNLSYEILHVEYNHFHFLVWILSFRLVQIVMVYSLQQRRAILYDSVLLQNFILHKLVYIMQFTVWAQFCVPLDINKSNGNML